MLYLETQVRVGMMQGGLRGWDCLFNVTVDDVMLLRMNGWFGGMGVPVKFCPSMLWFLQLTM